MPTDIGWHGQLPDFMRVHVNAWEAGGSVSCNIAHCPICTPPSRTTASNGTTVFDRAEWAANDSPIALLGMTVYKTPWLPAFIRKWGSRTWNRYYRAALPPHLRGTR